jgi:hypothetical protein
MIAVYFKDLYAVYSRYIVRRFGKIGPKIYLGP